MVSPFLSFALLLALVILAAKGAGYLSYRARQPMVLGELLVGVLLGPSLLDIAHMPFFGEEAVSQLRHLGELGVLLLMFIAGLELHLDELTQHTRVALFAGLLGGVLPVIGGILIGQVFGMDMLPAVFLGLTLGATSVSISAQTLMELGVLRSRIGVGLLGAAVIDDVVVILMLSVFMASVSGAESPLTVLLIVPRMLLYLALAVGFGLWVLPRLVARVARLPISQGVLSLALALTLIYAVAAETIGHIAPITGAFVAGLMFARLPERELVHRGMATLAYGFLVPVFFVSFGLGTNLRALSLSGLVLTVAVVVIAVVTKWGGAGLGAYLGGFNGYEAFRLGAGMISRGEMGLIIASLAIGEGWFTNAEFAAILATVIATTLLTPPLLRYLFREPVPVPKTVPSEEA